MKRLNVAIPAQLYIDMCSVIPWGLRSRVYRKITYALTRLVKETGLEGIMILEDLAESISTMPTPKLLALIAGIRESRKREKEVGPPSKGIEKRPAKSRERKKNTINNLLVGMSEEQLLLFAEQIKSDPEVLTILEGSINES